MKIKKILLLMISYLYFFSYFNYFTDGLSSTILYFLRRNNIINSPNLRILYTIIVFVLASLMILKLKKSSKLQSWIILLYTPLCVFVPFTFALQMKEILISVFGIRYVLMMNQPYNFVNLILITTICLYIIISYQKLINNKTLGYTKITFLIISTGIMVFFSHYFILNFLSSGSV